MSTPPASTTGRTRRRPDRTVTVQRTTTDVTAAEVAHRPVHPALRGWVRSVGGFDQRLAPDVTHLAVPSTSVPLLVSIDADQRIGPADGARPATAVGSFGSGLHDELTVVEADRFLGVQVDLTPLGALRLLGPLADLTRRVAPLEDLLGRLGRDLEDRVAHTRSWQERLDLVEQAVAARLATGPPVATALSHAVELITRSGGTIGVQQVATEVGWSRRHLAGTFRRSFGLSPKRVARLVRFERITADLGRGLELATVAAAAGLADQAHLANEVRDLTGLTPTQLRARQLPEGWFEVGAAGRRGSHPSKTDRPATA